MTKKDIIKLLEDIATYLELNLENSFRVSAYRKAASGLEQDNRSLSEIDSFGKIKGIGKGTETLINEYVETGKSPLLTELKEKTPIGLVHMTKIPGLGAKRVAKIYEDTGIDTIENLEQFLEAGKLKELPGFGKKTEENILKGIQELNTIPDRYPISKIQTFKGMIESFIDSLNYVTDYSIAGSARRMTETSGDIDFIIRTDNAKQFTDDIQNAIFFKEIIAKGDKKLSIVAEEAFDKINVDFRFIQGNEFYSTLQHFTGSKEHNIRMRQIAKKRHEKISEYGVEQKDGSVLTFKSESEFYHHFDLPYFSPAMRETGEEIDTNIGNIITMNDIKGDIHMHTTFSDGAFNIREMVEACIEKGYEYMVITDHSKSLVVANGLSDKRLMDQLDSIKKINEEYDEIDVYSGTEMDILTDGTLDYDNQLLKELDYVIASIHSSFNQTEDQIMYRMRCAMENPYVRHIAHPTGRIIGQRDGYQVNIKELLNMANTTNTVLEVNANPQRLDLSSEIVRHTDLQITVNTDAHHINHLDFMNYGVATLQKGLVDKSRVINTMSRSEFRQFIKNGK